MTRGVAAAETCHLSRVRLASNERAARDATWQAAGRGRAVIIRCHRCGAEWTSLKWEHCTVCCQTFAATRPGDGHRVGPYSPPGGRRCLEPREMEALGMWTTISPAGVLVWHGEPNKHGLQRRRFLQKSDNTPEGQQ